MQPTNPQRPVMDISAPRRPAPAPVKLPVQAAPAPETPQPADAAVPPPQAEKPNAVGNATPAPDFSKAPSLPVHEAPQSEEDDTEEASTGREQRPTPTDDQPADAAQTGDATDAPPAPAGPPTPPREKTPLPVGAIVATVFAMVALSAAAILVYLKT